MNILEKCKAGFRYYKKNFSKIAISVPTTFAVSFLVLSIFTLMVVYYRFRGRMIDEYSRMADGICTMMSYEFDGDKTQEYIDRNYSMDEYNDIIDYFNRLKDNYPDVMYLYASQVKEDGGHVVIETGKENSDPPGSVYQFDKHITDHIDDIMTGETVHPFIIHKHDTDEYTLTYLKPVFDSEGNYACSMGVDFSMDELYGDDLRFVIELGIMIFVLAAIILMADVEFLNRKVVKPLESIINCIDRFDYSSSDSRIKNVQMFEEVSVQTGNEIEDVYHAILTSIKETFYYITRLDNAKKTIQDNQENIRYMGQVMYKDELTSVGNKAAYNGAVARLERSMEENGVLFSVVMIDINNLKYVNDTYGHEKGDEYIRGCCRIICDIYEHSPVYRIGGDEFVVLLWDKDRERRQMLYGKALVAFNSAYRDTSREEWERYSASIGMADSGSGNRDYKSVFKRADELMYEAKMRFKEKNGSYR